MFVARIMFLRVPETIKNGYEPIVDCHTAHIKCKIVKIRETIDKKTGKTIKFEPEYVKSGDTCIVEMVPQKPMVVETFKDFPPLGRIALRDHKEVIGLGIVLETTKKNSHDQSQSQPQTFQNKKQNQPNVCKFGISCKFGYQGKCWQKHTRKEIAHFEQSDSFKNKDKPMNWRDLGASISKITGKRTIADNVIFRCGMLNEYKWEDFGSPKTIVNIRIENDPTEQWP